VFRCKGEELEDVGDEAEFLFGLSEERLDLIRKFVAFGDAEVAESFHAASLATPFARREGGRAVACEMVEVSLEKRHEVERRR
jgi:hypothetical protein